MLSAALRSQAERLMRSERWEAAELVLQEALSLPDDGTLAAEARDELLNLRAECVSKQLRGSETAVRDAERASACAPTFGPAFLKLGAALEDAHRLGEAASAYETAAKLCARPEDAEQAAAKAVRLRALAASTAKVS